MSTEWLAGLVVGSPVAVSGRYGATATIAKVDRLTPTQVVVGFSKYRRETGRRVGGDAWATTHIFEPSQSTFDAAEAIRLRQQISASANDKATTLSELRAMAEALAKATSA